MCKGPARNQILYYEDPLVGLLPEEQRVASLRGGVAGLNAWSYQDEASAQGWVPTVMKGDGGGGGGVIAILSRCSFVACSSQDLSQPTCS